MGDTVELDTLIAYYCFVNLGWPPSKYNDLPPYEKSMVRVFAMKSMDDNKREIEKMKNSQELR